MMRREGDALTRARSFLFCPADAPRRVENALASDADAVILDLEDGVLPDAKPRAREILVELLEEVDDGPARLVRVNNDPALLTEDLAALERVSVAAVMLPKATPDTVDLVAGHAGRRWGLVALIETACGLLSAVDIAAHPAVVALALGAADLGTELRLEERQDGLELLAARSTLVTASAAAGLRRPIDGVHLDATDQSSLKNEAQLARSLGFGGKLCIHPRQLAVVHQVFTPSPEAVEKAEKIVAAYDAATAAATGVGLLDGRLIDAPVAARAREILNLRANRREGER